ncbi:MAG: NrdH-redoxin [Candidatus Liptonbacteria bacterium RIFCSPLOWO2_01_FULL_56_20]|uniref:NrdH-redoxin n=1 Tax=Candidatus Liptonbacteria bacterium RIFCSPLOWO2_01_FULL_56_20 TaxID=1798652 RepID=A0A1G2CHR8_9BACT|nr:MAG: Glutaredoxin-like protein, YruB-family [Parcubacteria group bacterium GW2011_GWB1_56_8]OGY97551.1 MAG: NrdH-redoxin [Candidatus Liptonbacteria bacterium RIFCSPHIGHO2_01_FULL_56_18b]OGZ00767.1 MAG: NrdH-redoxin [Candidatus Liptonbacteria bacterium RIFCSPLOWO2_01_FULL_56_20]
MPRIIIYSTPGCVFCKMAREFLKSKNVPFEEKDVSNDMKAQEEMIKKTGQLAVPVIDVDGKIIVGFDKARLAELAGIK